MHKHINIDDYSVIASMLRTGYKQKDIAKVLGVTPSAISQEIKRNKNKDGSYKAHSARLKALKRRKFSKIKYRKIDNNSELIRIIEDNLCPLVSPEVIADDACKRGDDFTILDLPR
jgi:IS30 family transposase